MVSACLEKSYNVVLLLLLWCVFHFLDLKFIFLTWPSDSFVTWGHFIPVTAGVWAAGLCQSRDDVRIWCGFYESLLGVSFVSTSYTVDTYEFFWRVAPQQCWLYKNRQTSKSAYISQTWGHRRWPPEVEPGHGEQNILMWLKLLEIQWSNHPSLKTLNIENIHLTGSNGFPEYLLNKRESPIWAPESCSCNIN